MAFPKARSVPHGRMIRNSLQNGDLGLYPPVLRNLSPSSRFRSALHLRDSAREPTERLCITRPDSVRRSPAGIVRPLDNRAHEKAGRGNTPGGPPLLPSTPLHRPPASSAGQRTPRETRRPHHRSPAKAGTDGRCSPGIHPEGRRATLGHPPNRTRRDGFDRSRERGGAMILTRDRAARRPPSHGDKPHGWNYDRACPVSIRLPGSEISGESRGESRPPPVAVVDRCVRDRSTDPRRPTPAPPRSPSAPAFPIPRGARAARRRTTSPPPSTSPGGRRSAG
ncbi:MAG: hypothetical protein JWM27_3457 [Gemmatimonadetes bacterium]|nr:hypothetical protein [Gemmatimonadota bacterium]